MLTPSLAQSKFVPLMPCQITFDVRLLKTPVNCVSKVSRPVPFGLKAWGSGAHCQH